MAKKPKIVEIDEDVLRKLEELALIGAATRLVHHDTNRAIDHMREGLRRLEPHAKDLPGFDTLKWGYGAFLQDFHLYTELARSNALRDNIPGKRLGLWLSQAYPAHKMGVTLTVDPSLDGVTFVATLALYSVIGLLVKNAVYWTGYAPDEKRKEVLVDFHEGAIRVSDTGPGVLLEDEPLLFTAGFSRRYFGHGLGLFVIKHRFAGAFDLSYTRKGPLPGATFEVRLPEDWILQNSG